MLEIHGNFDHALEIVRELGEKPGLEIVNSINPYRIEGQKTGAFEIVDVLGDAPDFHCIPVGNAGNITAYWKGYSEYLEAGISTHTPRMLGFQAEGAAPLVHGHPIENPETVATAIRIGNPASLERRRGRDQRVERQRSTSSPTRRSSPPSRFSPRARASTASPPRPPRSPACSRFGVPEGSTVVCILTGHGLKDPDITIKSVPKPPVVDADYVAVARALGL